MGLDSLLAIMETRNVTPVETADVTPEPAWIKACTPVTSVTPQNGIAANEPAEISFDLEAFEERAAIMEFDGGLPRAEAERAARLAVTPGTVVEILATPTIPKLRVIVPAKIVQFLFVRDANLSRSASNLVRLLLGRASYYDVWLEKVVPQFQGRILTAKERLTLELTQRFLSHNFGAWLAAPAVQMADIRYGEPTSAKAVSASIAALEAARRQFLEHRNADIILADIVPALDVLFGTVAAYCGLHAGKLLDISPTTETGRSISDASLWDWVMLFDRDLRNHLNQIRQTTLTLAAMQSIAEHVERVLWQFGILLSDADEGRLWVDVSDEDQLVVLRNILRS